MRLGPEFRETAAAWKEAVRRAFRFWVRLAGIEPSKQGLGGIHLTRRFFQVLAGAFIVSLVALAGLSKYSTSPTFCNSCHIMEPYYKAWASSKHAHVACVECHYPPGSPRTLLWKKFQALSQVAKYVTRTYSSKPFAEIEDASCLRSGCHSERLLEGRVKGPKGLKFDHRPHLTETRRGRRLKCASCHSQIVVGKHVEVTYDTCYLCHFKGRGEGRRFQPLAGCLGCHDLPARAFRLGNMTYRHKDFVNRGVSCQNCHMDVVRGEGQAKEDRCFTCHNQPEKLARYGDTAFLHENHVAKLNVACFHCHEEITHGLSSNGGRLARLNEPPRPAAAPGPANGHAPTLTFDCGICHESKHAGQLEMYSGKAAPLGLPELPSPMYLAQVDCVGCHYDEKAAAGGREFQGRTFKASTEACVKCHGPKFNGIWEETRTELNATLAKLDAKLEAAKSAAASAQEPRRKGLRAKLEQAARLQRFVRYSKGEHNIYLASVALRKEDQALTEIGAASGKELADLSSDPLLSGGYCATMCHDKVGVKVPPETVKAFGKTMPHKEHAGMMGCVACHELGGHKKVPLRKDVKTATCSTCHPE